MGDEAVMTGFEVLGWIVFALYVPICRDIAREMRDA
jgi:hypothetical protein